MCYINIQRLNNTYKLAQLQFHIGKHEPDMMGITEFWLGPGVIDPVLHGYDVVSRLDRPCASVGVQHHGGIIMYRRVLEMPISHVSDSRVAGRAWFIAHAISGPYLIGLWYRPSGSDRDMIKSLDSEINELAIGCVGIIIVGDIIYQKRG